MSFPEIKDHPLQILTEKERRRRRWRSRGVILILTSFWGEEGSVAGIW